MLTHKQFVAAEPALRDIKPWPAVGDPKFLSNIEGENKLGKLSHRETIEKLRANLREFISICDSVVVIYQGRVVEDGTLADVRQKHKNQSLEEIFVRLTGQEGI